MGLLDIPHERILMAVEVDQMYSAHAQDTSFENPEDEDHNPIGSSVLDNMEISMVYVLPANHIPTKFPGRRHGY